MTTPQRASSVSRRSALAGLGADGLGVALAATTRHAAAQDAATERAAHPLVGTWLAGPPRRHRRHPLERGREHEQQRAHRPPGPRRLGDPQRPGRGGLGAGRRPRDPLRLDAVDLRRRRRGDRHLHRRGLPGRQRGRQLLLGRRHPGDDDPPRPTGAVVQEVGLQAVAGVRLVPGGPGNDEMLAMLAARQGATPAATSSW